MSSYAMHLAGYLNEMTPNDWATAAYLSFAVIAAAWMLFKSSGSDE